MQVAIPFWSGSEGGDLTVYLSDYICSGYAFYDGSPPSPYIYSTSTTAVPTGGTPPYTYQWSEVGGPSGINITSATAATTNFWENDPLGAWVKEGDFECEVTDAAMNTVTSPQCHVIIEQST